MRSAGLYLGSFNHQVNYKFPLHPYNDINLRNHAGFLCLTPTAEKFFPNMLPLSSYLGAWIPIFLTANQPSINPIIPFFSIRQNGERLYNLVKSAESVRAEVRIIGPKEQKPLSIPENLTWIEYFFRSSGSGNRLPHPA